MYKRLDKHANASDLFLVVTAVVTMGISSANGTNYPYWAYIPNPRINQTIHGLSEMVPIYVNDSNWTPGPYDAHGPLRPGEVHEN